MKYDLTIEIPKFTNIKYELENGRLKVDRILHGSSFYPVNYGFIENTKYWDGDALDGMVISDHSFYPGSIVPIKIIGMIKTIDDGEPDTKLIGVVEVDPKYKEIKKLTDISKNMLETIQDFFENYKKLENKKVIVKGFGDQKEALKELETSKWLFEKYGKLPKDQFLKLLKEKYPEQYQ